MTDCVHEDRPWTPKLGEANVINMYLGKIPRSWMAIQDNELFMSISVQRKSNGRRDIIGGCDIISSDFVWLFKIGENNFFKHAVFRWAFTVRKQNQYYVKLYYRGQFTLSLSLSLSFSLSLSLSHKHNPNTHSHTHTPPCT